VTRERIRQIEAKALRKLKRGAGQLLFVELSIFGLCWDAQGLLMTTMKPSQKDPS
jgi:hypothetical protein